MKIKNAGIVAAALVAAVLVLAPAAQAERANRRGGQQEQGAMGTQRIEMMARRLGLDDATKQKLVELFERQQAERKALGEKMQAEMQKLQQLVRDTASASALNAQLDVIRTLHRQTAELPGKGIDEMRSILGPEKTARVVLMQQHRRQQMREQVRGRMGQGGGRNRGGDNDDQD